MIRLLPDVLMLSVRPWFRGVTTTVKLFWSLREPLSVTLTVIRFVLGACPAVGIQVNRPVLASMLAPTGAPGPSENISVLAGRSGSVAVTATLSALPSLTAWFAIGAS